MNGKVTIMGIPFSRWTLEETVRHLIRQIGEGEERLFHLITANPEIAIASQSDEGLRRIIGEADLITPDGIGIVLAARRAGTPIPERVTGYDLLLRLLEEGSRRGWSFYFLGTDEAANRTAVERIQESFQGIRVAGRHHGFFTREEEPEILAEIQRTRPQVLITAMGAPYSDKWIYRHKQALGNVRVVFGVGGSLDVLAGKIKPAPGIWRKLNLEWLHRLFSAPVAKGQTPRWKRQAALPKFVYRAIIRRHP